MKILERRAAGWILGVALLARFLCSGMTIQVAAMGQTDFLQVANSLFSASRFHIQPTVALGYPLFLALGQGLFSLSQKTVSPEMVVTWAIFMQSLLGCGIAVLGAGLSYRLFRRRGLALGSGIGLALLPDLVMNEHVLFPETLFTVCLMLFLTALGTEGRGKGFWLGGVTGVLCLLNPICLLIPVLLVPLYRCEKGMLRSYGLTVAGLLGAVWLGVGVWGEKLPEVFLPVMPKSLEAVGEVYQHFLLGGLPADPESVVWGFLTFFGLWGVVLAQRGELTGESSALPALTRWMVGVVLGLLLVSPLWLVGSYVSRVPYEPMLLLFAFYGVVRLWEVYRTGNLLTTEIG